MIDSVKIAVPLHEYGRAALELVAAGLVGVKDERQRNTGRMGLRGTLQGFEGCGMRVYANENVCTIENSLTKFVCGNNFASLGRKEIAQAIEEMSERLHIDVGKGLLQRFDAGVCLTMNFAPCDYIAQLGRLARFKQLADAARGYLLYSQKGRAFCVYDKVAESGKDCPPLFLGRNVLRLETRYFGTTAIQTALQTPSFAIMEDLIDPHTFCRLWGNVRGYYNSVEKIQTIQENQIMNVKELEKLIFAAGVDALGRDAINAKIQAAQEAGVIDRTAAHRARKKIAGIGMQARGNIIEELNAKVAAAARLQC